MCGTVVSHSIGRSVGGIQFFPISDVTIGLDFAIISLNVGGQSAVGVDSRRRRIYTGHGSTFRRPILVNVSATIHFNPIRGSMSSVSLIQGLFGDRFAVVKKNVLVFAKNNGVCWSFFVQSKASLSCSMDTTRFDAKMFLVQQMNPTIRVTNHANVFALMSVTAMCDATHPF